MTNPTPPTVTVKGRDIKIKDLLDAQLLLLAREARLAQSEGTDTGRRFVAVGRIFDILESAIIEDADRDYIMDLTVKGDLELKDLTDFISMGQTGEDEKPKVRRGRPPKRAQ